MNNDNDAFDLLTSGEGDSMQPANHQRTNPRNEHHSVFSFSGRERRSTYWQIIILIFLMAIILGLFCGGLAGRAFSYDIMAGLQELGGMTVPVLVSFVMLVLCGLAVQVRRCHDLGWSGWLVFVLFAVGFIPYVGWISSLIYLIFSICLGVMDGQPFTNQYGPDPKGRNIAREQLQPPPLPPPQQPHIPQPQPSTTIPTSLGDQLRELKELLDEGLLTQDEFDIQKAKVLNR